MPLLRFQCKMSHCPNSLCCRWLSEWYLSQWNGVRTRANLTHSSSRVRSEGVASPHRLCPVPARSGAVADDQTMIRRITVLIGS